MTTGIREYKKTNMLSYQQISFRLLGFIPLALFIARLHNLIRINEIGHILWMCHISNLILAIALFSAWPFLAQISVPWLMFGLPLWIFNVAQVGIIGGVTSFGTHVGGLIIGLIALSKMTYNKDIWIYALGWYLILQQVCRMITPPELNVNIAHSVYLGWEAMFSVYWQYWLVTTILASIVMWLNGILFLKIFPPRIRDGYGYK